MRRVIIMSVLMAGGCTGASPPLSGGKPVEHWVEAVRDPDVRTRKAAVAHLGNTGATDPQVWDALAAALRDRDSSVRREAIVALMKVGPRAQEAVPALAELERSDPDRQVRSYAGKALKKLRGDPAASS